MHGKESDASDTQERLYKMLEKLQTLARDIPTYVFIYFYHYNN